MNNREKNSENLIKRYELIDFIINKSPYIIFLWKNEENWPVEFVTENISKFGYTQDEFLSGKIRYADIIHPDDIKRVSKETHTYCQNGSTEFTQEYRIFKKSGEVIWIDDRTFIKRDPVRKVSHFQGVILDVTEKKKTQEELEKSEKKYRQAFHQENFYKDLFMHDMRNILQSIGNSLEIYEYELKEEMNNNQNRQSLDRIFTQIERGAHLINNIKRYSELEPIKHSLEKQNIYQVIQKCVSTIKNSIRSKKIVVKIEPEENSGFLIMGSELINEAIENILMNSVIHNDNEEVVISILMSNFLKDQKSYIRIEISDNARGIEDSRKKNVFNRAHNQDSSKIGMGLGLSLVKIIIENINGDIWIEDKVPGDHKQGSKFILLIPKVE